MIRVKTTTVQERVKAFLEYENMTQSDFGRRIGVSSAYVTSIRKSIQPDKLERISKEFPNLNISWLVTGEGEMIIPDSDRVEDSPETIEPDSDSKVIRYWESMEATGGGVESFDDIKSGYVPLVLPDFRDCTDAVNIVGESMEPTYKSGSIILIKEWTEKFIEYGNPYLVVTRNGNRMVKILRKVKDDPTSVRCESVNPAYDPFEVEKAEILRLYIVKGVISKVVM